MADNIENNNTENNNTENNHTELSDVRFGEVLPVKEDSETDHGEIGHEIAEVIKPVNKNLIFILTILLVLALVGFFAKVLPFYTSAKETGESLGSTMGSAVGLFAGTYNGVTTGIAEGESAGKEQGLSAEDTTDEVANKIKNTGNLEVLVADGELKDTFTINNDVEYQALFFYKSTAVFSVDLTSIGVKENNGDLYITVPNPTCNVTIDQSGTAEMVEWQKHFWSGDTDAAYEAYMNSMQQISEKAEAQMEEAYLDDAKVAAQKAISQIAKSISGGKYNNFEVTFLGEEE